MIDCTDKYNEYLFNSNNMDKPEAFGSCDATVQKMPSSETFHDSIETAKKIKPILSKYAFSDACRAVFCINSFHANRSASRNAMAMNAALMSIDNYGDCLIDTYEQLEELFSELSAHFVSNPYDDRVLPILGQAKIEFGGLWYPVLCGCGLIQEYATLCFADPVCKAAGTSDSFASLLRYVESMAAGLAGGAWDGSSEHDCDIELPPLDHFNRTKKWFVEIAHLPLDKSCVEALSGNGCVVEKCHFISRYGNALPLFNPSLLIDYYTYACQTLDEQVQDTVVNHHLAAVAKKVYHYGASIEDCIITFPVFLLDGELLENNPCTFMTIDKSGNATLFFDYQFDENNLIDLSKKLISNLQSISIMEIQPFSGEKARIELRKNLKNVTVVSYINNSVPTPFPFPIEGCEQADYTCGALDILSILHAASSIEEINAFFAHLKSTNNVVQLMFSNLFPYFLSWKASDRNIISGAEDRKKGLIIYCDYNDSDMFYVDFFLQVLKDYPYCGHRYLLETPFNKIFNQDERGFTEIRLKNHVPFLGSCKKMRSDKPAFILIDVDLSDTSNLSFRDPELEGLLFELIEDLIKCYSNSDENNLAKLAQSLGGTLRFSYCFEQASHVEDMRIVDSTLGLKAAYSGSGIPTIYYSISKDDLMNTLREAKDRSVECALISALLRCLPSKANNAVRNIEDSLVVLSKQKKQVDLQEVELRYIWQSPGKIIRETDETRASAIKTVAYCADRAQIYSGKYYGSKAYQVLRGFQDELEVVFHQLVSKYKSDFTIESMVEIWAIGQHEFNMQTHRFDAFSNLDPLEAARINRDAIVRREDARKNIRSSRYCIESIFAFGLTGKEFPNDDTISEILSLSIQLLELNDMADMVRFNPKRIGIEIMDNKVPRMIEPKDAIDASFDLRIRGLRDSENEYGDVNLDKQYIDRAVAAFEDDTGIGFDCLNDVLLTLAKCPALDPWKTSTSNVVVMRRAELEAVLQAELAEFYTADQLTATLGYLILKKDRLMQIDGDKLDYLPFGRVKDRPCRVELQPIIQMSEDKLLFSPVILAALSDRWIRGISQRFLPVKTLKKLNTVIDQWKAHYEKALEKDIQKVFLDCGFKENTVFRGLKLHKKGVHPSNLGDYDGLAFDVSSKTLWIIECKVFEKIETAFDYMQLQERWFGKKGKLLKFERRIDYAKQNASQIVRDLGLGDHVGISIQPYLVCNKLFLNLIGESNFEVITLNELNTILADQKCKP